MLEDLTVTQLASAMARHAAARHRVVAENIANADTPGYRSRDIQPFSEMVNAGLTLARTRPGHLDAEGQRPGDLLPRETDDPAAPNGNSVAVEEEALRATETVAQHRLALAVYGKVVDLMQLGLGRQR